MDIFYSSKVFLKPRRWQMKVTKTLNELCMCTQASETLFRCTECKFTIYCIYIYMERYVCHHF